MSKVFRTLPSEAFEIESFRKQRYQSIPSEFCHVTDSNILGSFGLTFEKSALCNCFSKMPGWPRKPYDHICKFKNTV